MSCVRASPRPIPFGLVVSNTSKQVVGDFRRDASSIVVDQKHGRIVLPGDPDYDLPLSVPAFGSRVDRIGYEIVERLLDGDSVGSDGGQGGRRLDRESDASRSRLVPIQRTYLPGDLSEIRRLQLQFPAGDEVPDTFDYPPGLLRFRLGFRQNSRDGGGRLGVVEHAARAVNIGRQRGKRLADLMGESHGHRRRCRVRRYSGQFRLLFSQQLRRLFSFRDDRAKQLAGGREDKHQCLEYVEIPVVDLKMRERADQNQLREQQGRSHGRIAVVYADPKYRKKKQVEQIPVRRISRR